MTRINLLRKPWPPWPFLRPQVCPIHTADADATQLSSWVASAVCFEFATSWRQFRRVVTSLDNLPTTKSSCVVSAVWTHQSSVMTQFPIFCASHKLQNCKLGHDSRRRVHTADTTQLDRINSQRVQFPNFRQQIVILLRARRNARAGLCESNVSVRLCVCHATISCQNEDLFHDFFTIW